MNHFRGHNVFPSAVNVGRERSKDEWDHYPQYSKYSCPPPGSRSGSNSEWDRPGSSSQNWHSEEQECEDDPDGQPYDSEEEDPELARKRKELQVIQEQIMLKRASLALKTVDFNTVNPGLCTKEATSTESNESLRDRVKLILMQRNRMIGTKGPVAKTRRSSVNIQHNHPLKHKVKVALEQRFLVDRPVEMQNFEQISLFRTPSPPQIDTEEEENQGFMRFLNILNKGVDIDKLKEMVIDDTDSTPQPPQPPQSPHNSQCHNGARSSFSSPLVESPRKEEQQQKTNPDEQQQHLQNILRSLGLSLGTDEMSKLADRTQERLYGKRQRTEEEDKTLDEKPQSEDECEPKAGEEKYSPAHYTRSSSSSSTSSSPSSQSPPRTQIPLISSSHRHGNPSSPQRYRSPASSPRLHRRSRSPRRRRNSNSPYRSRDSHSQHRHRNSNSPYRSRDSQHRHRNSNSPYRSRDSHSPHRHRNSNSPYRSRDSHSPHRHRSLSPENFRDPLQSHPPTQPYPYPLSPYFSPHFPSQMYSDPYSQYASYYNYWAVNQPPAPESIDPSYQNYSQKIPTVFLKQQIESHDSSLLGPPPEETEFPSISEMVDLPNTSNDLQPNRCLVTIKRVCVSQSSKRKPKKKKKKNSQMYHEKRALNKLYRRILRGETKSKQIVPHLKTVQDWTTEMNCVIDSIKQTKSSNQPQTAEMSGAPGASQSLPNEPNITGANKKKKKRKKKYVFIERNEKMKKLLNDRPGPVTRSLAEKNPAKLGYNGKLVDIKDLEEPLRELWCDIPLKVSMEKTEERQRKTKTGESNAQLKEEKPVLTEEEIKANLKLKLEAFNNRMKKTLKQPAKFLKPQNTKVEDEI